MDINSKFIYLKRRSTFDEIKDMIPKELNPIIFIEDTSQLYTCGTFFNLGYPGVKVSEISGQIKVDIGQENFFLGTTGDSLSIKKGDGNQIIINSSALTKINTGAALEWDAVTKTLYHSKSGVVAGEYGQTTHVPNASIISVPNFVTDEYGHVISAGTSNVQIRDYVEQLAPTEQNVERNIMEAYNSGSESSDTAQLRKTNGMTFNDALNRLTVKGGIVSGNTVEINGGDLKVVRGVIIGNLQGDVSGSATPKIHLAEKPEYGGASKNLYGHVTLQDDIPGIRPPASSDNDQVTNAGVNAVAASPLMVWNALEQAKEYADTKGITIEAVNESGTSAIVQGKLNLTDDFVIDENNNLSLRWLEIQ